MLLKFKQQQENYIHFFKLPDLDKFLVPSVSWDNERYSQNGLSFTTTHQT